MKPEEIAAIAEAVRQAIESANPLPPKVLFDLDETAELTGLPPTWIQRMSETGQMPSRKIGRYRKWSLADIEWIVENSAQSATSGELLARAKAKAKAAARTK